MKYDIKDFEDVIKGKVSIQYMSEYYKVSKEAFIKAMNRKGYYIKKTKIKITTPHQTKIVFSINECAYELKVSDTTIRNYLDGKKVKLFEDMGVKLEVVK